MGIISIGYAFLIELPRWVFPNVYRPRLAFQTALAIGLALSGFGSLGLWGLYKHGVPYDKFVHVLLPTLLMYTGTRLFVARGRSMVKAGRLVAIIIAISSVGWEIIEHIASVYFHLGFFGVIFDRDSIWDIAANFTGIALAGLALYRKL